MTAEGMGACLAVEGATTKAVFEAYVEQVLAPRLAPGQMVILDNLALHKSKRVIEIVEGKGCRELFLSAYSPDLPPIGEAFSKVKALLEKAAARTREALVEGIGRALEAVTVRDAAGRFTRCGYPPTAQSS